MTCSAFDTAYTCTGALGGLSICSGICGDSIRVFSEKCDNGKKAGCLNNCNPDPGYTCTGAPGVSSICTTKCGDYIVAGTEECDNGNRKGCTNCKVDAGYTCKKDPDGRISMCSKI
jgi:hypothetical protein